MKAKNKESPLKGRPPKFQEESAPITLTLPRRIIHLLDAINPDRAKAIVRCVETLTTQKTTPDSKIEILQVSEGSGLIVIPPLSSLKRIPGLEFLEISPFRYILAIPSGTAVESLEISIVDLLEHLTEHEEEEREVLRELRSKIGEHRRESLLSKCEVLYFDTRRNQKALMQQSEKSGHFLRKLKRRGADENHN